jgi:hypothetical protein
VINQFGATLQDSRVTFLGNVAVGRDVSLAQLRSMFNGVRAGGSAAAALLAAPATPAEAGARLGGEQGR